MLIGYARVSTDDQNLDLQHDALQQAGCDKIYTDRRRSAASWGSRRAPYTTTWRRRALTPAMRRKRISVDSLLALRQRRERLPRKSPERAVADAGL